MNVLHVILYKTEHFNYIFLHIIGESELSIYLTYTK